jgi:hypothetical protein
MPKNLIVCLTLFFSSLTLQAKKNTPQAPPKNISISERKIAEVAAELHNVKSVQQWLNSGSRSVRLFRRQHFSKFAKASFPKFIHHKNVILFLDSKSQRPVSVLSARRKGSRVHFFYNQKDISRHKGESLNEWMTRLYVRKQRNKKSASILNLLFAVSWAQNSQVFSGTPFEFSGSQTSYWAAIVASMAVDEWSQKDLVSSYMTDGRALISGGQHLNEQYNLYCDSGEAAFDFDFQTFGEIRIRTQLDRSSSPPKTRMSLTRQQGGSGTRSGEIGRIAYDVRNDGQEGAVYLRDVPNRSPSSFSGPNDQGVTEELSQILARPQNGVTPEIQGLMSEDFYKLRVLSDAAIACCNNAQCFKQGRLQGNDPANPHIAQ